MESVFTNCTLADSVLVVKPHKLVVHAFHIWHGSSSTLRDVFLWSKTLLLPYGVHGLLFLPCLVDFWRFHPYMFFYFFKCFFLLLASGGSRILKRGVPVSSAAG